MKNIQQKRKASEVKMGLYLVERSTAPEGITSYLGHNVTTSSILLCHKTVALLHK